MALIQGRVSRTTEYCNWRFYGIRCDGTTHCEISSGKKLAKPKDERIIVKSTGKI